MTDERYQVVVRYDERGSAAYLDIWGPGGTWCTVAVPDLVELLAGAWSPARRDVCTRCADVLPRWDVPEGWAGGPYCERCADEIRAEYADLAGDDDEPF